MVRMTGPILAEIRAGKPVDAVVLPDAGRKALDKANLSASQTRVSSSLAGVGVQGETGGPLPQLLQGRSRFEPGVGMQEAGRQWLARAAGIAGLQQQGGGQSQRQQGGNAEIQQKRPDAPGGGVGG